MNIRFIKGTRYYELHLTHDLFNWVVIKCYGRIDTKLGKIKSIPFPTQSEATDHFNHECDRRRKRGYKKMPITAM